MVIAPVTSKSRSGTGDIALKNSYAAGLVRVSWVRLGKVATLLKGDVVKKLGRLDGSERNEVATKWHELYSGFVTYLMGGCIGHSRSNYWRLII